MLGTSQYVEVCCVKIIKRVKSSCTMVTVSAVAVKQKLKSVSLKIHCKMATSVHPHVQTLLDRLSPHTADEVVSESLVQEPSEFTLDAQSV